MAVITFMSDFGGKDHYVAAVKARLLSINPELKIIDISHDIEPYDIIHGSFVLKSVFREFPVGTIHLAAVNTLDSVEGDPIIALIDGHYFVGADNGMFSLISEHLPETIIRLNNPDLETTVFPARDVMARSAAMLAGGATLNDLGQATTEFKQLLGRQLKATKKQISGNVISVDRFGNAVTNIDQEIFNILQKDRKFMIRFGREEIHIIHPTYASVEPGDCVAIFNSNDLLEIGINKGNASELLGLSFDAPVVIHFEES
jgi:S-adenosylmethionine hydrolase